MEENNPVIRHETTDINVWAVGKFGFLLVGITLLSLVLLFGLMKYFQGREAQEVAQTVNPESVFPEPRLLRNEPLDLAKVRENEDKVLHSYAWVDQPKGVVRIPIDRAIDVLTQKGLPSRPNPQKGSQ
jgi:hypothetical protein